MMNYSFLSSIQVNEHSTQPMYLQIAQGLAAQIKQGVLKPGYKLPGSRTLASALGVNRNTIVSAIDELLAEGWVVSKARSGVFIAPLLPLITYTPKSRLIAKDLVTAYNWSTNTMLETSSAHSLKVEFNDGSPDPRLSPIKELGREYHRIIKRTQPLQLLNYNDASGDAFFRKVLSSQLNEFRGLRTQPEHIFISRGSMMGIYLAALSILRKGDKVAVSELNYQTVNLCFSQCGGELVYIPVDGQGLDTRELEKVLEKQAIRLLYITSHHHYPTTVSLSAKRRIKLYALAKKYQFLILEDDYDFDYHYQNTPTLPLASMDTESLVIYVGSFSKLLYPGIRIGFVVAPLILIEEMSKYRRIIDLQGDHLMERTIANLMLEGVMDRYLRKSKALYKRRKEHFCRLLREEFKSYVDFIEPEGGMAVWVTFKDNYPLIKVASLCREKNLFISNALNYNSPVRQVNACRMGFASMTETEMKMACNILKDVLDSL